MTTISVSLVADPDIMCINFLCLYFCQHGYGLGYFAGGGRTIAIGELRRYVDCDPDAWIWYADGGQYGKKKVDLTGFMGNLPGVKIL